MKLRGIDRSMIPEAAAGLVTSRSMQSHLFAKTSLRIVGRLSGIGSRLYPLDTSRRNAQMLWQLPVEMIASLDQG